MPSSSSRCAFCTPSGTDTPVQRSELLEHEVALAVIVIEVVTVFRQPAARAVLTVILLTCFKEIADAVRNTLDALNVIPLLVLCRKEIVELIIVIAYPAPRKTVLSCMKTVADDPGIAAAELLDIAYSHRLVGLTSKAVMYIADTAKGRPQVMYPILGLYESIIFYIHQ